MATPKEPPPSFDRRRDMMEPMGFASVNRPRSRDLMAINEYEHTDDELEFLVAMDRYIIESGNKFPSWSEALSVAKAIGYHK